MPHLTIEYSANVGNWTSLQQLCDRLRAEAEATGLFPVAGIRVRAIRCDEYSIADGNPELGFIDISVRVGAGRPLEARKQATERMFRALEAHLTELLESRPIALSMEMREIDPELSPKINRIRDFMEEA